MDTLKAEVKEFLTSRRARLTPDQAGLTFDGRVRRVPGLRREEVAELAGISVEYYVLLERGNLTNVSDQVLTALAGALRLDEAERIHLHNLARASRAGDQPLPPARPAPSVTGRVQAMLDGFTTGPAWVRNECMDILATNATARALYDPIYRALPDRPNTARHLFLAPGARAFWVDAGYYAEAFAAKLRLETAATPGEPRLESLVAELVRESEAFRARWAAADVALVRNGIKRFRHPEVGRLDLHFETMDLNSAPGLVVSIYQPAGPETGRALAELQQRAPGASASTRRPPGNPVRRSHAGTVFPPGSSPEPGCGPYGGGRTTSRR